MGKKQLGENLMIFFFQRDFSLLWFSEKHLRKKKYIEKPQKKSEVAEKKKRKKQKRIKNGYFFKKTDIKKIGYF